MAGPRININALPPIALLILGGWLLGGWNGEAQAASQCVMLGRDANNEYLVNRCKDCRVVNLTHKRPGSDPAIQRQYTVPGKSQTQLYFRGPGRTRVVSDTPCRPAAPPEVKEDTTQCAQLQNTIDGGVVIINTCNSCREVEVKRTGAGGFTSSKTHVIAGKAYIPVEKKGASKARIVSDKKCR